MRRARGLYEALDGATKIAFGDGKAYAADLLRAIGLAGAVATNRADFELLLRIRAADPRGPRRRTVRAWYVARNTGPGGVELAWVALPARAALRISPDRRRSEARPRAGHVSVTLLRSRRPRACERGARLAASEDDRHCPTGGYPSASKYAMTSSVVRTSAYFCSSSNRLTA